MNKLNRQLISVTATLAAFAGILAAQRVVVTGTGDPSVDVATVQANRRVWNASGAAQRDRDRHVCWR